MDVIGLAQQRQQDEVEHALQARAPVQPGRTHCANLDCEAPILPVRQRMGAQLCIDCQRAIEQKAQPCARGAV